MLVQVVGNQAASCVQEQRVSCWAAWGLQLDFVFFRLLVVLPHLACCPLLVVWGTGLRPVSVPSIQRYADSSYTSKKSECPSYCNGRIHFSNLTPSFRQSDCSNCADGRNKNPKQTKNGRHHFSNLKLSFCQSDCSNCAHETAQRLRLKQFEARRLLEWLLCFSPASWNQWKDGLPNFTQ